MASKHEKFRNLKRAVSLNIYDGILDGGKIDSVERWLNFFLTEAKNIEEVKGTT